MDQHTPTPAALYDHDPLDWADHQAALLRQLADGRAPQADIDWTHIIEEIQDVGLSELRACTSLLTQALVHLLKLHAWPQSQAASLWREEVRRFLDDAEDRFTPSMRQRIDIPTLYAKALRRLQEATDDSSVPQALPESCPFTLDNLLAASVQDLLVRFT